MSEDLVLQNRKLMTIRWGGTAIGAVLLNIVLLGMVLSSIAHSTFFLSTVLHWLWTGSIAGGIFFVLLHTALVWASTISLGFITILLLSWIYGKHRLQAARINCYFGSPVWLIFCLINLFFLPITWASALLSAGFAANAFGQFLAVRYLHRRLSPDTAQTFGRQIEASPVSIAQLEEKISAVLQTMTLAEANSQAAQCLKLLPARRAGQAEDELAQLTQKMVELKHYDQAEALSALHLRLVEG